MESIWGQSILYALNTDLRAMSLGVNVQGVIQRLSCLLPCNVDTVKLHSYRANVTGISQSGLQSEPYLMLLNGFPMFRAQNLTKCASLIRITSVRGLLPCKFVQRGEFEAYLSHAVLQTLPKKSALHKAWHSDVFLVDSVLSKSSLRRCCLPWSAKQAERAAI